MSEVKEATEGLEETIENMISQEDVPRENSGTVWETTEMSWWDIRRVDNLNWQWKQVNDYFFKKQEMGTVDLDEWEKQLAIQISVNLSPYTTPSTIQRCINVMRRTNAKATKFAAIDLIRDRHTPPEKRFAVLEYRARIHFDLLNKKKENGVNSKNTTPSLTE